MDKNLKQKLKDIASDKEKMQNYVKKIANFPKDFEATASDLFLVSKILPALFELLTICEGFCKGVDRVIEEYSKEDKEKNKNKNKKKEEVNIDLKKAPIFSQN